MIPVTERLKTDILVVGAGPAGSLAARYAAEKGVKVTMIEARSNIGVPVRCGELVPSIEEITDIFPDFFHICVVSVHIEALDDLLTFQKVKVFVEELRHFHPASDIFGFFRHQVIHIDCFFGIDVNTYAKAQAPSEKFFRKPERDALEMQESVPPVLRDGSAVK